MTEDWLGGRGKGWLRDHVAPKKEPAIKTGQENFSNGVIFIKPKCPVCRNKTKLTCYRTEGDTRYYKCPCGNKFKAIEKDTI